MQDVLIDETHTVRRMLSFIPLNKANHVFPIWEHKFKKWAKFGGKTSIAVSIMRQLLAQSGKAYPSAPSPTLGSQEGPLPLPALTSGYAYIWFVSITFFRLIFHWCIEEYDEIQRRWLFSESSLETFKSTVISACNNCKCIVSLILIFFYVNSCGKHV